MHERTIPTHDAPGWPDPSGALPERLVQRVVERTALSYRVQVLDIGAGAGLGVHFARHAKSVTVVDPSGDLLDRARARAERAGIKLRLVRGELAACAGELGRFRLVTAAPGFRRWDGAATLATIDALLDAGAALAVFDEVRPRTRENAIWSDVDELLAPAATEALRHGEITAEDEAALLASPLDLLERATVIERRATPVAALLGRIAGMLHDADVADAQAQSALAELGRRLRRHADAAGLIPELVESRVLIARRSHDLSKRWAS